MTYISSKWVKASIRANIPSVRRYHDQQDHTPFPKKAKTKLSGLLSLEQSPPFGTVMKSCQKLLPVGQHQHMWNECMGDKRDINSWYFIIVPPLRHCDVCHLYFWQAEFLNQIVCVFCYYYWLIFIVFSFWLWKCTAQQEAFYVWSNKYNKWIWSWIHFIFTSAVLWKWQRLF